MQAKYGKINYDEKASNNADCNFYNFECPR